MIRAGYCYHDGHLRIVLNDPDLDDYVLVVGVTSVYPNAKRQDKTCVLDKDRDPEKSHPFIELKYVRTAERNETKGIYFIQNGQYFRIIADDFSEAYEMLKKEIA